MVVLSLFTPDIIRDKQKVFGYFKPKFNVDDNSELTISDRYIPTFEEAKTLSSEYNNQFRLISLSKIYYELKRVYDRATSFNNDLKITYAILKEIQKLSDENKFTFYVLYIPTSYAIDERSRFEKLIGYDESLWNVIPKIKLLLSDMDIDFIDPVHKMKEYQKNTTDALYKGHTTPLGNKVIADVVSQYLKNKKSALYF